MIGIYKITNNVTGKFYIGQSKNIERRFIDHNTKSHNSEIIDKNINLYGKSNFTYEILEECSIDELDEKENYYIKKYNAVQYGYNILNGGQLNGYRCGENNGNAKITESDVYYIREMYSKHKLRSDIYNEFKDKISESGFNSLWQGRCWTNVHMDVYTEDNKNYYIGRKLTDDEVMDLRNRYVYTTLDELYKSVKDKYSYSGFKKIIYGYTYSHLPIYDKTHKIWINN